MLKLDENRKKFNKTKRLSFFKRRKCLHDYIYLGIQNQYKLYGCLKCGQERGDH